MPKVQGMPRKRTSSSSKKAGGKVKVTNVKVKGSK